MAEALRRAGTWLAQAWLLAVLALAWQQAGFWREGRLDSNVFALLPGGGDPRVDAAAERLAATTAQQVVVLLSAGSWEATRRGAQAFDAAVLAAADGRLRRAPAGQGDEVDALAPYRRGLLTRAQERELRQADARALGDLALARLLGPGGGGALSWREDPLGLWPAWLQAQAGRLGLREHWLALREDGRDSILLRYELTSPGFRLDGQRHLLDALDHARAAAGDAAGGPVDAPAGGVPLHAEAAAARAHGEINTIGLGSLAAVLLLAWLAFRGLRPILLVGLSLLVGVLCGLSATAAVFGQVHLLTLVFGASLVGVAEDYGIHYFASRQAEPTLPPRTLLRRLAPVLALALGTSVLAYLALGLAPMPGLRQMALFSAAGLVGAFLTVMLWFPWLDRRPVRASGFARAVGASLASWPRWPAGRRGAVLGVGLACVIGAGLAQLRVQDDLRSLQSSPPALLAAERELGQRLDLPSPAQFLQVSAADPQALLEREEAVLDALDAAGTGLAWRAVSEQLPSLARQRLRQSLVERAEGEALAGAARVLGQAPDAGDARTAWLEPERWLALPASAPLRGLWLGGQDGEWSSLVLVSGLTPARAEAIEALAAGLPGVRWVDRTRDYSRLLGHYRATMGWLLLTGYAAVALALAWRFRGRAWRALAPTVLAALGSLALLGWIGEPLQLFGVLAQLLLLGVGVDYGIFLLEHEDDPASWLAICVGAASTWLAFGLLALSSTPALRSFGLVLGTGLAIVWLLSPCFRPRTAPPILPPTVA